MWKINEMEQKQRDNKKADFYGLLGSGFRLPDGYMCMHIMHTHAPILLLFMIRGEKILHRHIKKKDIQPNIIKKIEIEYWKPIFIPS